MAEEDEDESDSLQLEAMAASHTGTTDQLIKLLRKSLQKAEAKQTEERKQQLPHRDAVRDSPFSDVVASGKKARVEMDSVFGNRKGGIPMVGGTSPFATANSFQVLGEKTPQEEESSCGDNCGGGRDCPGCKAKTARKCTNRGCTAYGNKLEDKEAVCPVCKGKMED